MNGLFIVLWLVVTAGLIVFVARPVLFTKLFKLTLSRLKLAIIFGILFLSMGVAVGATAPPSKLTANTTKASKPMVKTATKPQPKHTQTVTTQSKPAAQPSQPATPTATPSENAQAASILTTATNFYAQLYQQGQTALGTQQYSDAYAGLAALNDPTSSASTWSTFNQNMQKTDYYTTHVVSAYNNASNIYPDGAQPSSLSDWNNDMNQADSDLHQWTQQATSWQISEITTDQLNGYANTFNQDLNNARNDITKL